MDTRQSPDYSVLDRPDVLRALFHPRREAGRHGGEGAGNHLIPTPDGEQIGARFHLAGPNAPNILFFHGNGEIVADYDDLAEMYLRLGINFLPVDYRGYGRSTGQPGVAAMMQDCHSVMAYATEWLVRHGYNGPLVLMGRSLGSASALELAYRHPDGYAALIVESGFAHAAPLLRLLGVDPERIGFVEERAFSNLAKMQTVFRPTLVIHAERDHIIPFSDGQALFEACGARDKTFLPIAGANHNDLLFRGFEAYLGAIQSLTTGLTPTGS